MPGAESIVKEYLSMLFPETAIHPSLFFHGWSTLHIGLSSRTFRALVRQRKGYSLMEITRTHHHRQRVGRTNEEWLIRIHVKG